MQHTFNFFRRLRCSCSHTIFFVYQQLIPCFQGIKRFHIHPVYLRLQENEQFRYLLNSWVSRLHSTTPKLSDSGFSSGAVCVGSRNCENIGLIPPGWVTRSQIFLWVHDHEWSQFRHWQTESHPPLIELRVGKKDRMHYLIKRNQKR